MLQQLQKAGCNLVGVVDQCLGPAIARLSAVSLLLSTHLLKSCRCKFCVSCVSSITSSSTSQLCTESPKSCQPTFNGCMLQQHFECCVSQSVVVPGATACLGLHRSHFGTRLSVEALSWQCSNCHFQPRPPINKNLPRRVQNACVPP